jgi:protein-L-isoaspartate(D-aspartate) O-methyltransferase
LSKQGYLNIEFGVGDGSSGWSEHAPFDKILVAAAPELIPASLLNQLKSGGKMVIPAGVEDAQQLMLVEKDQSGRLHTQEILQVRFSPLVIAH